MSENQLTRYGIAELSDAGQGVGSNTIALDRGPLSSEHIVKFQRSGLITF